MLCVQEAYTLEGQGEVQQDGGEPLETLEGDRVTEGPKELPNNPSRIPECV